MGRELVACEWQNWAMAPPTDPDQLDEMLDLVYKQGYMDARSYLAQERGIEIDDNPY